MKYVLSFLVVIFSTLTTNAQSDPILISDAPFFECYNCDFGYNNYQYKYQVGVNMGIGYGVVKEINSRFDLFANLGYNFWRFKSLAYTNRYKGSSTKKNNHLINFATGGRFHFLKKDKFSLYTGLTINFQTYFEIFRPNFGLTVEPNIGWRRSIGNKHEFFTSIGYGQHLTSYSRVFKRRPGKVSLNMGFNLKIGGLGARRNEG